MVRSTGVLSPHQAYRRLTGRSCSGGTPLEAPGESSYLIAVRFTSLCSTITYLVVDRPRYPQHPSAMVFTAATVESVEFDASTGLLVIRNPLLALEQEGSILHSNGWTEASEADLPEEGLPPTPRAKGHHQSLFSSGSKESNKLKRGAAGKKGSQEGAAEEGRSSSETTEGGSESANAVPALFGGNKRVYKRAA